MKVFKVVAIVVMTMATIACNPDSEPGRAPSSTHAPKSAEQSGCQEDDPCFDEKWREIHR